MAKDFIDQRISYYNNRKRGDNSINDVEAEIVAFDRALADYINLFAKVVHIRDVRIEELFKKSLDPKP